jgi:hypothetical protein
METYTDLKELEDNPRYSLQRREAVHSLNYDSIDAPIINLITNLNDLPFCFSLQSCYGHFLYNGQEDLRNLEPLPITDTLLEVEYRIAYIALCIENSMYGRAFFEELKEIPNIDPNDIQFCCADWFWKKQVNSYVLQVEPGRFKHRDMALLDYEEAVYIENLRNRFFDQLGSLLVTVRKRQ